MSAPGSVVLAGGRSSRMGTPKASLDWHGAPLLERTVRVLARATPGPVVVVHAPGQQLPALPAGVLLRADPVEGRGPLQGLAVGLAAAAAGGAREAFVCATDLPFLHPVYVERLLAALAGEQPQPPADVALPVVRGHRQPLAAAYRTAVGAVCARLVADGERRPAALLRSCLVEVLDEAALLADPALAAADPLLRSVDGVNTPREWAAALAEPAPEVLVRPGDRRVRARTVGQLRRALGLPAGVPVEIAGTAADSRTPLVAGDVAVVRPG